MVFQFNTQATAKFFAVAVLSLGLGVSGQSAFAAPPSDGVVQLQTQWADAMYKSRGEGKEKQLEKLSDQARTLVGSSPDDANALIWEGIVLGSYAGAKGGLGALSSAKAAKEDLETALELNADAMQGSAYTSLGVLYLSVPGWPVAKMSATERDNSHA